MMMPSKVAMEILSHGRAPGANRWQRLHDAADRAEMVEEIRAAARDAIYAGCFLGMSAPDRLKGWFQPVSGALVLIALLAPLRAVLSEIDPDIAIARCKTRYGSSGLRLLIAVRRP